MFSVRAEEDPVIPRRVEDKATVGTTFKYGGHLGALAIAGRIALQPLDQDVLGGRVVVRECHMFVRAASVVRAAELL